MSNHFIQITEYIAESFLHTWPYLLITIPIAVGVKMSGASRFIERAFSAQPMAAIFLATVVGAFSPLCACSVIPVVAALLIGGVPLGPVMSFWLASPSMDPELFLLTVGTLGWELAIWRLAATLLLSLGGGFITHFLIQRNILGENILRDVQSIQAKKMGDYLKPAWDYVLAKVKAFTDSLKLSAIAVSGESTTLAQIPVTVIADRSSSCGESRGDAACTPQTTSSEDSTPDSNPRLWTQLGIETRDATVMVIKFMLLAWFLGALIRLYVPESWIISTLGGDKPWAIITAAVLGIPVYTSNLAAMPLVGELLTQGMHPGAALAFLIAGPTTTLPAMSAVWGLVNRRVFILYIALSLIGAVIFGYIYSILI
jgi:uncharacterized membrane protein YraQ (UPF0718 family)